MNASTVRFGIWIALVLIGFLLDKLLATSTLAILVPTIAWTIFRGLVFYNGRKLKTIRGPEPSFPDGNVLEMVFSNKPVVQIIFELIPQYGRDPVIRIWVGPIPFLFVTSGNAVQEIFLQKSDTFRKGYFFAKMKEVFGPGLFMVEGEEWNVHRKIISPAFRTDKLRPIVETVVVKRAKKLMDKWYNACSKGPVKRNIFEDYSKFALETICEAAFGYGANAQDEALVNDDLLTDLQQMVALAPLCAVPAWMKPFVKDPAVPTKKVFQKIEEVLNVVSKKDEEQTNIAQMLLNSEEKLSRYDIIAESSTFAVAGHETTAVSVMWTTVFLAKYPEVKKKVLQELDTVLQGRAPNVQDLQQLPYLKAVISESMRLYPPGAFFERTATQDETVQGIFIPKGTGIWMNSWFVHRDEKTWSDPLTFNPERFLGTETPSTNTYFPFGLGPRVCIGKQFALWELAIALAMIYQNFTISLIGDGSNIEMDRAPKTIHIPKNQCAEMIIEVRQRN